MVGKGYTGTATTARDAVCAEAEGIWEPLGSQATDAWHVLYVKSRQEKMLADELGARGIGHYLPLIREEKYYGRRRFEIERPLFPGYLFLRGTLDEVYTADRTKRVARIIQAIDQRQLDWELRNIHLALTNRAKLDPYPFLVKGIRVAVRTGPFRGLQGVVEDRSRVDRLVLQVQLLGTASSLEIHGAMLEPLD